MARTEPVTSRSTPARWPILYRLLVSFVLIGVFCSLLLGFLHIRSSMRMIEQSLVDQAEVNLLRIRDDFDRRYAEPRALRNRGILLI